MRITLIFLVLTLRQFQAAVNALKIEQKNNKDFPLNHKKKMKNFFLNSFFLPLPILKHTAIQ